MITEEKRGIYSLPLGFAATEVDGEQQALSWIKPILPESTILSRPGSLENRMDAVFQEQLELRLEVEKALLDYFRIDSAEKPTEN